MVVVVNVMIMMLNSTASTFLCFTACFYLGVTSKLCNLNIKAVIYIYFCLNCDVFTMKSSLKDVKVHPFF